MKLQIGIDGKTYEVEVEVIEEDTQTRPGGYQPPYAESAPTTVRSQPVASAPAPAAAAEGPVDEAKVCRSPVAGMVIKINVEVGQMLEADELIMVLEAMKMETNVTVPGPGKVKAIKVAQGDGVKVNQVLVELE